MSSNLKVNTILPSVGSNIGLGTNGGNLNVDGGCKVQVGTALTLGHTVGVQFATQNLHTAGFEVNQINASGIITASQFKGDGSQLTGISAGTSLSGSTNNTVCTVTGANAIQGEANLTFDGSKLGVNISSPHYTLDINGDNGGAFTASTNSTAGQLSVVGKNSVGNVSAISRIKSHPSGNGNTSQMAFETRNSSSQMVERLRITSTGRVGINESSPNATLHIKNADGANNRLELVHANDSANEQNQITFKNNTTEYASITSGKDGSNNSIGLTFGTGGSERLRIDSSGHISLRNTASSHQEIQWYRNTNKYASIGWGDGSANWEFKHFRADNQADNPYANIDFFTGSTTSPTRALRITEDGNHIREKHSRFATRIDYNSGTESPNSKLNFQNAHVNVGNDFNGSNDRFTAPVDGDYAFWFHTNVEKSGGGSYYATWYKNGSEANGSHGGRMYDQHSGSGWNNLSGCIMLPLQEGDYVEVYNGGQTVNYDGNSYGQFMGWLVG